MRGTNGIQRPSWVIGRHISSSFTRGCVCRVVFAAFVERGRRHQCGGVQASPRGLGLGQGRCGRTATSQSVLLFFSSDPTRCVLVGPYDLCCNSDTPMSITSTRLILAHRTCWRCVELCQFCQRNHAGSGVLRVTPISEQRGQHSTAKVLHNLY